jgi:hypothetical protein
VNSVSLASPVGYQSAARSGTQEAREGDLTRGAIGEGAHVGKRRRRLGAVSGGRGDRHELEQNSADFRVFRLKHAVGRWTEGTRLARGGKASYSTCSCHN